MTVLQEGWMWKQGEVKKTWKKRFETAISPQLLLYDSLHSCPSSRWCVLTPRQLTYYKSNDYTHALGNVPIVVSLEHLASARFCSPAPPR